MVRILFVVSLCLGFACSKDTELPSNGPGPVRDSGLTTGTDAQTDLDVDQGQVVHAYVVLQSDHIVDSQKLLEIVSTRLAEYMVPEEFHFLDELPVKGPGKVDRELLKMRAETGIADL